MTNIRKEQLSRINRQIACDLKHARLLSGITQKELAAALGVSYQQIQKYESGSSKISAARLVQLTAVINLYYPDIEPSAMSSDTRPVNDQTLKICGRIMRIEDSAMQEKIINALYCLTA